MPRKSKPKAIEFGEEGPGVSDIADALNRPEPRKKRALPNVSGFPIEYVQGSPSEIGKTWGKILEDGWRTGIISWDQASISPLSTSAPLSTPDVNVSYPSFEGPNPLIDSIDGAMVKSKSYMQQLGGVTTVAYELVDGRRVTIDQMPDGSRRIRNMSVPWIEG